MLHDANCEYQRRGKIKPCFCEWRQWYRNSQKFEIRDIRYINKDIYYTLRVYK